MWCPATCPSPSPYLELCCRAFLAFDAAEQFLAHHRHDALVLVVPHHRVALAAARLAVGEQRGVVAIPGVVKHALAQVVKHLALGRILVGCALVHAIFLFLVAVVRPVRVVEREVPDRFVAGLICGACARARRRRRVRGHTGRRVSCAAACAGRDGDAAGAGTKGQWQRRLCPLPPLMMVVVPFISTMHSWLPAFSRELNGRTRTATLTESVASDALPFPLFPPARVGPPSTVVRRSTRPEAAALVEGSSNVGLSGCRVVGWERSAMRTCTHTTPLHRAPNPSSKAMHAPLTAWPANASSSQLSEYVSRAADGRACVVEVVACVCVCGGGGGGAGGPPPP